MAKKLTTEESGAESPEVAATPAPEAPAYVQLERKLPLIEWADQATISPTLTRALALHHGDAARFTATEWQAQLDALLKREV